jgi:hypothetical protein
MSTITTRERAIDRRLEEALEIDRVYFYKRIKDMLMDVQP